ncbi:MAG: bifunctional glutamate N-acetyltransferase/amino-acid acetyltransferase ArgJ [Patescibacteria group bacterium]
MEWLEGGVTAPLGFLASGVACGLKKNGEPDLALLAAAVPAASAGVFTQNRIKGHSLAWTQRRTGGRVRAILANSGSANACLGPRGDEDAAAMAGLAARTLGVSEAEVLLASTGVIGRPVDLAALAAGLDQAAASLSRAGGGAAARAIMTTDTHPKEAALAVQLGGGRTATIGGMAKGAGMIHPNMATLLAFLTTDAPIGSVALDTALRDVVGCSFNAITVDGDTSPCDTVLALATGLAGGDEIQPGTCEFDAFRGGLCEVAGSLAAMVAHDGEGATKKVTILVTGAASSEEARIVGRSVAASSLVKTALFGADANWGRILSAVGNAGVPIVPERISIRLGPVAVCSRGAGVEFDETAAREYLLGREIAIGIDLGAGDGRATVRTCDLSYDYVRINGSYRS